MRSLTTKQKQLLTTWVKENRKIYSIDDLLPGQFELLESINDSEILWSECNRFIADLGVELKYGKRG